MFIKNQKIDVVNGTEKITLMKAFLHHMSSFHLLPLSSYRQEPDNGFASDLIDLIKNGKY